MSTLARDFERRAKEHEKSADTLFKSADFDVNPKQQALFIVGKVTANVLYLLSEQMQYDYASDELSETDARRKKITEKSNAIRTAAAAGDWDEFDRLAEGFGGGSTGGDGE